MRRKKNKLETILPWICLILIIAIISYVSKDGETEVVAETISYFTPNTSEITVEETDQDMVGVWISYIALSSDYTEDGFIENYEEQIETALSIGATDVFVHVRAFSDALYDSDYFPWSHIITGTQGETPSFDPLEYMIEVAHENGLNFHAWINPLRIKLETVPSTLASDNPYTLYAESNPYYFIEMGDEIYINPAYTEMRNLIVNGVTEIVENYDVDGIHFDDYFYPESMTDEDSVAYENYLQTVSNPLSLDEWRTTNINSLISQVYREIKEIDEDVVFGISPQANFSNNEDLYADVISWCSIYGYIDYIAPQIYFSYDNSALGFTESLTEWIEINKHEDLEIYIGLAMYKAGTDADGGTWLDSNEIIASQISDVFENELDGIILYDVLYIGTETTAEETENLTEYLESLG